MFAQALGSFSGQLSSSAGYPKCAIEIQRSFHKAQRGERIEEEVDEGLGHITSR